MDTDVLFQPIRIGSLPVKNRIVMGPMALVDSCPPGYASSPGLCTPSARRAGSA